MSEVEHSQEPTAQPKRKRRNPVVIVYRAIAGTFRFLRATVANLLLILVLVLVFTAIASIEPEPDVEIGSILSFEPKFSLVEDTQPGNPLMDLFLSGSGIGADRTRDVAEAIRYAATDDRIIGLELRPHRLLGADLVQLEAIGDAVNEFKQAGKWVEAYSPQYTQSQYHLASHADQVFMHPFGDVVLQGFAFETQYFRSLIDRVRLNVHVFRAGDFKSAVEPYTRDDMSPEVKSSYEPILDQIWSQYVERVSANRELEPESVRGYADDVASLVELSNTDVASMSLQKGLIDGLLNPRSYRDRQRNEQDDGEPPRMSMQDYISVIPNGIRRLRTRTAEEQSSRVGRIGVVTIMGALLELPGTSGSDIYSSYSPVEQLKRAQRSRVDALVLRIDSPGGSVLASEKIRVAIQELRSKDIPVVASMAGTAASGGYWIAAETDLIMASPSTITGSIGVFAMFPSFEETLAEVGVNTDGVYSVPNASRLDPFRGLNESDAILMQALVDRSYENFLNIVSNGRDMTVDQVRLVAGGRIWTGQQAIDRNLVDELGDLDMAFERAAELAGLTSYRVREFKESAPSGLAAFLVEMGVRIPLIDERLAQWANESSKLVNDLWGSLQPRQVYALCEPCSSPTAN